jgi:putative Mn2+ efflux pump MntP
MSFLHIVAIAVALAMDAFAVSIATGVRLKRVSLRQFFRLAWHFGLFQAMMPVIGWAAGLTVRDTIERYDHWIAFGLLAFVGTNMIREAFKLEEDARA